MVFKKNVLSEQFMFRGKVFSKLGWGIVASMILLTALLLHNSFKGPVVGSLFQGGVYRVGNVAPFSINSSISASDFGNSEVNVSIVGGNHDLIGNNGGGVPLDVDLGAKNGSFRVENGGRNEGIGNNGGGVPLNVDLGAKNGSFRVESRGRNEEIGKNGVNVGLDSKNHDLGENGGGNVNLGAKNGSFRVENGGRIEEIGKNGANIGLDSRNPEFKGENAIGVVVAAKNGSFGVENGGRNESKEANDGLDSIITEEEILAEIQSRNFTEILSNGSLVSVNVNAKGVEAKPKKKRRHRDGLSSDNRKVIKGPYEDCDLFDGKWVRDDSGPYYPPGSCPYVDKDFDCQKNGRPDDAYIKWKWQPFGCNVARLNATDFLERLRGKRLVFVGDSINRNMWESLVCILRHSVKRKKRVYEISGRHDFKKKGVYAFRFEDYNCSLDYVAAPFLVKESTLQRENGTIDTLRLDLMDPSTEMYRDADIMVFNTGHWWTHEKTSKGEDYYQEGDQVFPRLKVLKAFQKALRTWARWVNQNIDTTRTHVFFRGYSVAHFWGGQWNSGGQCHKETEPIIDEAHLSKYPSKMRALENVIRRTKAHVTYLNVSRLTDYRKDAHPSIYRREYKTPEEWKAAERSQDCSHWCLPGVPDTWNELLYALLLKGGEGVWGKHG